MPIDFPNSPTLNQLFTVNDQTWRWDGSVWRINEAQGIQGPTGPTGVGGGGGGSLNNGSNQSNGTTKNGPGFLTLTRL